MHSYTYIQDLFKNILMQSISIQGRFWILAQSGGELNSDEFGQVLNQMVASQQKFPGAFLMPPRSRGEYGKQGEWETFHFTMFFLTTTYYNGTNVIKAVIPGTQTSGAPVVGDWDQMKVAAQDFIRMVDKAQRMFDLMNFSFRLRPGTKQIEPVSFITNSNISGVKLDFDASLFLPCEVVDYTETAEFTLPEII